MVPLSVLPHSTTLSPVGINIPTWLPQSKAKTRNSVLAKNIRFSGESKALEAQYRSHLGRRFPKMSVSHLDYQVFPSDRQSEIIQMLVDEEASKQLKYPRLTLIRLSEGAYTAMLALPEQVGLDMEVA